MSNGVFIKKIAYFAIVILIFQFVFVCCVNAKESGESGNVQLAALKPLGKPAAPPSSNPQNIPVDEATPGESIDPDSETSPSQEQSTTVTTPSEGSDFTPTPDAGINNAEQELYDTIAGCGCCSTMFIIPAFVIHLILAIWVLVDAKNRRGNAVLWSILTLFFGIVGWIVYLTNRPSIPTAAYPPQYPNEGQNFGINQCPHCGGPKAPGQRQCPSCGAIT